MQFQWKENTRWSIQAQKAGEAIERLHKQSGKMVTPQMVLIEAQKKRSPLHSAFEWDDALAADKHRLETARYLLRTLVILVQNADKEIITRAYVHIEGVDQNQNPISFYTNVYDAMNDKGQRAYLLAKAMKELKAWRTRYEHLDEVSELISILGGYIV